MVVETLMVVEKGSSNMLKQSLILASVLLLAACSSSRPTLPSNAGGPLAIAPAGRDLLHLPAPKGKVLVSVYAFRDQTGQFKPAPDSAYSTAITQGATAWLIKALSDSNWFSPVERENLQNLLTERKIWRAVDTEKDKSAAQLPPLTPAPIVIEGAVTSYESDVRTGGFGVNFLGEGLSGQVRADQITVSLRAVNVRNGQILANVISSKTIWSKELSLGVYRFVGLNRLLQVEGGYTHNEPVQLCVKQAIETAVAMLIAKGVRENLWVLDNPDDPAKTILDRYHEDEMESPPTQATVPQPAKG